MNVEWAVVTLTGEDYEAIRVLWEQAGLKIKPVGRDSRAQFERQLAGGTQQAIGLRDGERLIGVVLATHDGRKGWINRLAVHPDYRRQGVGQRLIHAAEQWLLDQGMQVIAALIEDWNAASLALFKKAGYADFTGIHYVTKRVGDEV